MSTKLTVSRTTRCRSSDGGDLDSELEDGPLTSRQAAQRLLDATRGVAAAHQAGVLHRDLKPRNVMIDSRRDRALVADFGLAREIALGTVGSDPTTIARFTRTGQILGTPPYMAPEQIRDARDAEVRSDVYSLGATLYHTLTGRPPFQAASPAETLRQVLESDPVPPRQLNAAVDLDLDTIAMKCLEKEAARRYKSADELADDLQRFLDGRPITARRISAVGRVMRWSKRNRRTAALIGLSTTMLLALVASVIVGLVVSNRKSGQLADSLRISRASLEENYSHLLNSYASRPGQNAERKKMLQRSVQTYRDFIAIADNSEMKSDLGIAQVRLAEANLELVGPDSAQQEFKNAVVTLQDLNEGAKKSLAVQRAMSDAHNGIGQALMATGDYEGALAEFQRAGELRQRLTRQYPDLIELERKFANALTNQGLALARLGQFAAAETRQQEAQQNRQGLLARDPGNASVVRDSGKGEFGLALLALAQQDAQLAQQRLESAITTFQGLLRLSPNDGAAWMRLVRCQLLLSTVAMEQGLAPLAKQALDHALENVRPLAVMSKYSWDYRLEIIPVYQQGVRLLLDQRFIAEANENWQDVEQLLSFDSGEQFDEEALHVIRIRLIHRSQQAVIAIGSGDREHGKELIQATLARWEQVRQRFADDQEMAAEMKDLARLVADLDV